METTQHNQHVIAYTVNRLHTLMQLPVTHNNSALVPTIHIKARNKAGQLESYSFNKAISHDMASILSTAIEHVWDWYTIYNTCPINASLFTKKQTLALQDIQRVKKNKTNERAYILLHEEQVVICNQTGISYAVRLPVPSKLLLDTIHPLAIYGNVETVIQSYFKSGIKLETELQPQVLAGMLITTLRHKDMLVCKDIKKGNLFLQQATGATLSYALRYFYNLPSGQYKPRLSLNLEDSNEVLENMWKVPLTELQKQSQEAEIFILNFIRACKGESVQDRNIIPASDRVSGNTKVHAKVYTDTVRQSGKMVKVLKQDAVSLLKQLPVDGMEVSLTVSWLSGQLSMLAFLSDKARKETAAKILGTWQSNEVAMKLAQLVQGATTKAIEDDLLSFSQQIEQDLNRHKAQKQQFVDFASLITNKG